LKARPRHVSRDQAPGPRTLGEAVSWAIGWRGSQQRPAWPGGTWGQAGVWVLSLPQRLPGAAAPCAVLWPSLQPLLATGGATLCLRGTSRRQRSIVSCVSRRQSSASPECFQRPLARGLCGNTCGNLFMAWPPQEGLCYPYAHARPWPSRHLVNFQEAARLEGAPRPIHRI